MVYDEKTCPREHCAWANSIYQKCTWPGKACPYQSARDRAQKTMDDRTRYQLMVRQAKRQAGQNQLRARHKGVYPAQDKWTAHIHAGGKSWYLGTYPTEAEAIAARELAQTHRGDGDFLLWLERWRDAEVKRKGSRDKG